MTDVDRFLASQAVSERPEQHPRRGIVDPVKPDISIIVVNYNTAHLLEDMWDALIASKQDLSLEVIIVDNASRDNSVEQLHTDPRFSKVHLIVNTTNVGFGRANNQGLQFVTGRYVLLLNTDAFVAPDTLRKTVDYLDTHPRSGVLGVRLVGRDGSLQPSCRYFPTPWNLFLWRSGLTRFFPKVRMVDDMAWDHASSRECDWMPGCYLLVRKEVIDAVGLFDPRYFLYSEEVDFCRRTQQAGWKLTYFGGTTVIHLGGESAKSDAVLTTAGLQISTLQIESELLYFRKHYGAIGLVGFVVLSWLADGVKVIKWVVKQRSFHGLRAVINHAAAVATLVVKTVGGTLPTR